MGAYSYMLGAALSATGTAAISASSANVVGTGTDFGGELRVGDVLYLNGEYRVVETITDDTHLAVTEEWTTTASGLAMAGYKMYHVEDDMHLPAPKGMFVPYSQPLDLGDGGVRGAGWPTAEWRWGFLTLAQRQELRGFAPGASELVAVKTTINENDAYAYFVGQAIWPQAEAKDAGRRPGFVLRFRALVEIP